MSDEHQDADDLYHEAARLVDYWLRLATRLSQMLGSPGSSGLEFAAGATRDRTVPSDAACKLADVKICVAALSNPQSEWYVHPAASAVVIEARIDGHTYSDIADRHGLARREVPRLVEDATANLFAHFAAKQMHTYLPQEYTT
jgi:hypothetical protein